MAKKHENCVKLRQTVKVGAKSTRYILLYTKETNRKETEKS